MSDTATATATGAPPMGLTVLSSEGDIHLRRRWRRPKHFFFLLWVIPLIGWLIKVWLDDGFSVPLLIGSLITASIAVRLVGVFVNHSDIRFDGQRLKITHGPLPSLGMPRDDVDMSKFTALRMGRHGRLHAVEGVDEAGEKTPVVRPLATLAQAAFVRDVLASALGVEARGTELEHAADDGLGASAVLAALVPLAVVGGVLLFGAAITSSAEGSLQITTDEVSTTFVPDGCRAGSVRGFNGAELTSSEAPGVVVRVIRDPLRGSLIAVERAGGAPDVFDGERCTRLDIHVQQSDTNINDVWAMEGSADVACEGLQGRVSFSTCH